MEWFRQINLKWSEFVDDVPIFMFWLHLFLKPGAFDTQVGVARLDDRVKVLGSSHDQMRLF
jgi:hypothetical protein